MLSFAPALLFLAPAALDPVPLPSTIREVTVYGANALVRRHATVPGDGTFVLRGLPQAIDPDSVRVRCSGGEVASVDVRDRLQDAVPNERLQALRDRLEGLRRELSTLTDERQMIDQIGAHLGALLEQEAAVHRKEVFEGRPSPDAWAANLDFVVARLGTNKEQRRDVQLRVEAKERQIREIEVELGRLGKQGSIPVRDLTLEILNTSGAAELVVDTFVRGTGWAPLYDLRTARDLSSVELVYRARVWQNTGEEWGDVELLLSTARPQMGAQGPDPSVVWVDLFDPQSARRRQAPASEALNATGYASDDKVVAEKSLAPVFTSVEQEGLSVRFRLPRKETIESRDDPTTVLVGRSSLAIAAERTCVPALDPTVWLRAKAKNTSEWTLLPGRAAVFFGEDFLGHAELETIQPGQELTLHLGADPGLTVERAVIDDEKQKPGFLSSRGKLVESWRLHFENHGTAGARPDGSVTVFVRESLPRSRDDRIKVELTAATPSPSGAERWAQDKDEKSILTWDLRVPKNGSADIVYETTISYPNGMEIIKHQ